MVTIWNADSNFAVARCSLPRPASCVACSPWLDEVAVGTPNSNEILILKVHRQRQADPHQQQRRRPPQGHDGPFPRCTAARKDRDDVEEGDNDAHGRGGGNDLPEDWWYGEAVGIEFHLSKQLLPSSELRRRWEPDIHARAIFSRTAVGKTYRSNAPTLVDGDRESTTVGGGTTKTFAGTVGISDGHTAPPFYSPSSTSKASPGRQRARCLV